MTLLSIRDLDVRYGGIHAVRQISLQVEQGAFVAIIGANGAGKTTLLRTISGLKRVTAGSSSEFRGQEISKMAPDSIVSLGICHCPEGRHIWKQLTVLETLRLGAYARGHKKTDIADDLERVWGYFPKLCERQRQLAGTLSGGEQQMLAVGRARSWAADS